MQRVLQRADEDTAAVVVGDLALLNQRHRCHQRLNRTAIVTYTAITHTEHLSPTAGPSGKSIGVYALLSMPMPGH